MGNLADELADAWDEDELEEGYDEEPDMNFQEIREEEPEMGVSTRDSGVDVSSSPAEAPLKPTNLTPPTAGFRGHRRQPSEYDGSDYGGDSDLESPGMPPGLVARMDQVEALARRGTESNGTDRDGVVKRVIEDLKDLGGQSGVEGGATRYFHFVKFHFYSCINLTFSETDSSQPTQLSQHISTTKLASSNPSRIPFSVP